MTLNGGFFKSLKDLADTEAPDDLNEAVGLSSFIVRYVPAFRRALGDQRRSLRTATDHSSAMTKEVRVSLAASVFTAAVSMYVSTWNQASGIVQRLNQGSETRHAILQKEHIESVRKAQEVMQQSDIVFVSPNSGDTHWLMVAVEAAQANFKGMQTLTLCKNIAVLNIVCLPIRGMIQLEMLDTIRDALLTSELTGPFLIFLLPHQAQVDPRRKAEVSK
jgi:hypothetical protein